MHRLFVMLIALMFSAGAHAAYLMQAVAPNGTGETITLTDEKWECPSGETDNGLKWDAKKVIYHDPRDGETAEGCYVIDARESSAVVILIFKTGSLAGAPIYLPSRMFRPTV